MQGPGPTFISLVNYLVPAWAVVAGAVFLDEPLSLPMIGGLVLILVGIALSEAGPGAWQALKALRARKLRSSPARVVPEDA